MVPPEGTFEAVTVSLKIQGAESELREDITGVDIVNAMYTVPTCRITFQRTIQASGALLGTESYLQHIGQTLDLEIGTNEGAQVVFKGEVTGVSFEQPEAAPGRVIMEGHSLYHRLEGVPRIRFFDDSKISDAINSVLGEHGRPAGEISDNPTDQHKQIVQLNESDWNFCVRMARENGLFLWVKDEKVLAQKAARQDVVTGNLGSEVVSYTTRTAAAPFKFKSQQGDHMSGQNALIVGDSNSLSGGGVGFTETHDASNTMFQQGQLVDGRNFPGASAITRLVEDQTKAGGAGMMHAFGETQAHALQVGGTLDLQGSEGLDQEIFITSIVHHMDNAHGYTNQFQGAPVQSAHAPSPRRVRRAPQFVPAKVTDNDDPEKLGRIKVVFHHDDTETETPFLRVMQPLAGPNHGMYWIPQVDDEVIVCFHYGQSDHPFVIGSVFASDNEFTGSNPIVDQQSFVFQTPAGCGIGLWDNFEDNKAIVLRLPSSEVFLSMSEDDPKQIALKAEGGAIKLIADEIIMEADTKISLKSQEITVEGSTGAGLDSGGNYSIKASGNIDIEAGGQVNVKGAMINLN